MKKGGQFTLPMCQEVCLDHIIADSMTIHAKLNAKQVQIHVEANHVQHNYAYRLKAPAGCSDGNEFNSLDSPNSHVGRSYRARPGILAIKYIETAMGHKVLIYRL